MEAVTAQEVPSPVAAGQQIIVKFRDTGLDPSRPGYLAQLLEGSGARAVYLRPMSGGAHVLNVTSPANETGLDAVLQRLNRHPDVEYAEADRRKRRQ